MGVAVPCPQVYHTIQVLCQAPKVRQTAWTTLAALTLMTSVATGMAPPVVAQEAADHLTTASEVVDRATLKRFAQSAKAYFESFTTMEEAAQVPGMMRDEDGPWRSGDMYLIRMVPSGTILNHGADPTAENKDLFDLEDELGRPVVQNLLAAAEQGGDFVDYRWDGTDRVAYAIGTASVVSRRPLVFFAGFSQDLSSVPVDITPLPRPEVTAAQVVDRETLKTFVEAASSEYQKAVYGSGLGKLANTENNFRKRQGDWNWGEVYVFVITTNAYTIFHGAQPAKFEGQPFEDINRQDVNGIRYLRELLAAGINGGGFVEYMFDNPAIEGDEEMGSQKISYAKGFPAQGTDDQWYIVVSGFYPDS